MFSAPIRLSHTVQPFLKSIRIMSCATEIVNPLKRNAEDCEESVENKVARVERVKRKKCAILISYSGVGYLGLQRNPGRKTIEEDLLKAMFLSGVINQEYYDQPRYFDFQRAARTDKGVSAVRQVLSAKLPLEVSIETINSYLPEQIRMIALKRTTKGFNCKGNCDARTYSYTMPSFALAPQDVPLDINYRISKEVLDKTKETLKEFLGTKNYHNFTSKKKPGDPSAKRYMISLVCEDPQVIDGMEYITLKVKGQSFMLHQIRKMVGLLIAIVKGLTTSETFKKVWADEKIDIPIAPGVGLVLEEVHYDRYNKRFGNDGVHSKIDWSEEKEQLEEFKKKYIISTIIETEKNEKSMINWLETLPKHTYDVRETHLHEMKDNEDEEDLDDEDEESGDNANT